MQILQHAVGDALASMTRLTRLHLGIFLTDEAAFQHHVEEHSSVDTTVFGTISYAVPAPIIEFERCSRCFRTLEIKTLMREREAGEIICGYLPSLSTVTWASFVDK
jgi:hypothetical protein